MVLLLLYVAHLNSDSIFTLKCIVVTAIVYFLPSYSPSNDGEMTIDDDDDDDDADENNNNGNNDDNDDNDNDICNEWQQWRVHDAKVIFCNGYAQ